MIIFTTVFLLFLLILSSIVFWRKQNFIKIEYKDKTNNNVQSQDEIEVEMKVGNKMGQES